MWAGYGVNSPSSFMTGRLSWARLANELFLQAHNLPEQTTNNCCASNSPTSTEASATMDSRSPSRERLDRSPTPRSRYRSSSRSASPPPRRNGRFRGDSRSRSRSVSRSRSRSWSRDRDGRGRSESPLRGSTKVLFISDQMIAPIHRCVTDLASQQIVVEKLTKNITEDHLREIFGQYGTIKDLDLPMNRQFMTNRGTAYILYVHEEDAEAAIAHMHEAQLDGATINVSIVLPRRKFSPSPPTASRGANIDPRNPAPGPRSGFGGPRGGRGGVGFGGPGGRARSPPRYGGGGGGGGGGGAGGRQGRNQDNTYRPTRSPSYSRSRSPPRRGRAPSYGSRSRSPPPRRRGGPRRDSVEEDRGDRRRSHSYDSYRSRSRSRGRGYR
ncbi:hypothetical protein BX600DRAFT_437414 [Xylariales sp. PMI_506]|nr:hypothetical protein BX600DRAFT_437414 [Xylariales sp. PMI_506]